MVIIMRSGMGKAGSWKKERKESKKQSGRRKNRRWRKKLGG